MITIGEPYSEDNDSRLQSVPERNMYVNVTINKLLTKCRKWQTVLAIYRDVGYLYDRVNLATAMHRLAKLVRLARALPLLKQQKEYHDKLQACRTLSGQFSPRGIANVIWALGALGDKANSRLAGLLVTTFAKRDVREYKVQELSNVAWAMGVLHVNRAAELDYLLEGATERRKLCIPQALSNICWACASLKHTNTDFLLTIADESTTRLSDFQSQTLANMLWAYSVLSVYPEKLFKKASLEIINRFNSGRSSEFKAQELSNILIAYARGNIIVPELLQVMEDELSSGNGWRLKDFSSQAICNSLWAFATVRWYPAQLLPLLTQEISKKLPDMAAQEIANTCWAFARFAYHPGRLMGEYLRQIPLRTDELEEQAVTNLLWALAVLTATHSDVFLMLLDRFKAMEEAGTEFVGVQYCQVLQAVLLGQFEKRGFEGGKNRPATNDTSWRPEIDLKESIVDKALTYWGQQQRESSKVSAFHLNVCEVLSDLGIEHQIEYLTANDLFSVDIAIVQGDKRIAIEVDGPYHFPVNARTPLGHTMIRRRLLRAAGWKVVPVPWYEWFFIESHEGLLEYMAKKLKDADAAVPAKENLRRQAGDLLSTDFAPGLFVGDEIKQESYLQNRFNNTTLGDSISTTSTLSSSISSIEGNKESAALGSPCVDGEEGSSMTSGLQEALMSERVTLTYSAYKRLHSQGFDVPLSLVSDKESDGMSPVMLPDRRRSPTGAPTLFSENTKDTHKLIHDMLTPTTSHNDGKDKNEPKDRMDWAGGRKDRFPGGPRWAQPTPTSSSPPQYGIAKWDNWRRKNPRGQKTKDLRGTNEMSADTSSSSLPPEEGGQPPPKRCRQSSVPAVPSRPRDSNPKAILSSAAAQLLDAHSVGELKEMCKAIGLPGRGRKVELAERIAKYRTDPQNF